MTAKDFLEQYKVAYLKADKLKTKLDQLIDEYDCVRSGTFIMLRGSQISKPTERKVEKVQQAYNSWADAQIDALEVMRTTFSVIMAVEDMDAVDVLCYRYLDLLTWNEIKDKMGYSESQVYRFHWRGLGLIEQLIN